MRLRPVTFHYKESDEHGGKPVQYGLIAEEVAEVLPNLAYYANGRLESVKYHFLPPLLLAGYQQQQHVIEEQASKIATLEQRDQQQTSEIGELKQRLLALEALLPRITKAAVVK
jgi:hypothetical protein